MARIKGTEGFIGVACLSKVQHWQHFPTHQILGFSLTLLFGTQFKLWEEQEVCAKINVIGSFVIGDAAHPMLPCKLPTYFSLAFSPPWSGISRAQYSFDSSRTSRSPSDRGRSSSWRRIFKLLSQQSDFNIEPVATLREHTEESCFRYADVVKRRTRWSCESQRIRFALHARGEYTQWVVLNSWQKKNALINNTSKSDRVHRA